MGQIYLFSLMYVCRFNQKREYTRKIFDIHKNKLQEAVKNNKYTVLLFHDAVVLGENRLNLQHR